VTDRKTSRPKDPKKIELEDLEVSKETAKDLTEREQEAVKGGMRPGTFACPPISADAARC
jgi:hypothetical protein